MTVLVLSRRDDLTADRVVDHLSRRNADVARMDLSEFPSHSRIAGSLGPGQPWTGLVNTQHRDIAVEGVRAVYYRRPAPFAFPTAMPESDRAWCAAEARHGLGGLLAALPAARWINPVEAITAAERKPVQLAAAVAAGLTVPETLITNCPERARAFAAVHPHGAVYKSLRGAPAAGRGVLYTSPITAEEITDGVAATALQAVYANTSLITQYDAGGTATSSSTTPSLMALMLERLDARPGHRVLEIGTGTGYNAALLVHALGEDAVTSIDLDSDLVTRAHIALDELGYHPRLIAADGTHGAPEHAPYDRVIATCGLGRVPASWLGQVAPGGIILVNLGYALARLTVTEQGSAIGRFTDYAAFMRLRPHTRHTSPTGRDIIKMASGHGLTSTGAFPEFLDERPLECLRALTYPDVVKVIRHHDSGAVYALGDPESRSWSRVQRTESGQATVVHAGPRNLWEEYTALAAFWDEHGRPEPTSCGLTVTADGTHVLWLEDPDHPISVLP